MARPRATHLGTCWLAEAPTAVNNRTRLPSFLVVGAAKSGTTALHEYLRQHPQIFMSPIKETNFFALDGTRPSFGGPRAEILNNDAIWRFEDYARLFSGVTDERAIGEVCPRYLFTAGTACRIKRRLPEVRIVAVLRNPADRAFSGFSMYRRDGLEPAATLAEAITDEPRRVRENWAYAIHVKYGFTAPSSRSISTSSLANRSAASFTKTSSRIHVLSW
jgi:hypothetical protein